MALRELSLFTGAGGGLLGSILLGWHTVCAVEIDSYCRKSLLARQCDGVFERFPIWDDIRTFDGKPWRGHVDIVTGGFPCQDISAAGKGSGIDGAKSSLWFEMARIIREVRPRFVLVENSPMLTVRGIWRVLGELAAMGYDAKWGVLGAYLAGANHERNRIWIIASDTNRNMERAKPIYAEMAGSSKVDELAEKTTNSQSERVNERGLSVGKESALANAEIGIQGSADKRDTSDPNSLAVWIKSRWRSWKKRQEEEINRGHSWWGIPRFEGVDDGYADRMDGRIKATGNAQVGGVVALAWEVLGDGTGDVNEK